MKKIRAALISKLTSLVGATPIAWPNKEFDPTTVSTASGIWLQCAFVPASDYGVTLGDAGADEVTGFFQVTINAPANKGDISTIDMIDLLRSGFKVGATLTNQDQAVRITNRDYSHGGQTTTNEYSAGGASGVWFSSYVTIYWSARHPRN